MTDWFPTLYSAAGGNVTDLGEIDGIDQWDALLQLGPSKRKEMLYNCNPMGTQSPTGCALRYESFRVHFPIEGTSSNDIWTEGEGCPKTIGINASCNKFSKRSKGNENGGKHSENHNFNCSIGQLGHFS